MNQKYIQDQIEPIVGISTDVRTSRHYTKEHFEGYYNESLDDMLKVSNGSWSEQSETLYGNNIEELSKNNKRHKWTWVEDEFIRNNYKYLSDNVIGLAINVPGRLVKLRRLRLGLKKTQLKESYKVVIWCNRLDYEKDLEDYSLNGYLPSKTRTTYKE